MKPSMLIISSMNVIRLKIVLSLIYRELRNNNTAKHVFNSTLAIGGAPSPFDSFVVAESSVPRTNLCTEKPANLQNIMQHYEEVL